MEPLHIHLHGPELKGYCGKPLTKDEHGSIFMYEKDLLLQSIRAGVKPASYFKSQTCADCWRLAGMPA